MRIPRWLAAALLAFAVAAPLPGRPGILGVVTQATQAYLGTGPVSVGASIYDGDRLSTNADGALTLRGGGAMFYLARQSRMILHSLAGRPSASQADLLGGTVAFSASRLADLEILADGAHIYPANNSATVGQVTVLDPKTLYVYARQGPLMLSYEDETELIPEGKAFRVSLDPPDDDSATAANKAGDSDPHPDHNNKRRHRAFLLVLLGIGAAVGGIVKKFDSVESPDHP